MHAIATVVTDLRERPGAYGLVWANGGYVTKHAFGVYSHDAAGRRVPPRRRRHPGRDRRPARPWSWPSRPTPPAPPIVEAYTVMHDRDGRPEQAIATCLHARRPPGLGHHPPTLTLLAAMREGEWVGRAVSLDAEGPACTLSNLPQR